MPKRSPARLLLNRLEDRWTPAAGDLDFTFGDQGVVNFPNIPVEGGGISTTTDVVAVMPDGRLVVAGQLYDSSQPVGSDALFQTKVTRLMPNGSPDATFGTDGSVTVPFTSVAALLIQPDGRVLVADGGPTGTGADDFAVARLTSDGRIDASFGANGIATVMDGSVSSLAVGPDGRILMAGTVFGSIPAPAGGVPSPTQTFAVVRLTPDGRPDPLFDADGIATVAFPVGKYNYAEANAVAVQPDGKVVLAGMVRFDEHTIPGRGFGDFTIYDEQFAVAR